MEITSLNSFMLISDDGPNFNPASVLNQKYLYCLVKILKVDFICIYICDQVYNI